VQERVQDAEKNGTSGEETAKAGPTKSSGSSGRTGGQQRRQKSGRFARQDGDGSGSEVSPQTLLARLEQQSEQLGVLRAQLDETRKTLVREREAAQAASVALQEERRNRERLEANLKRERSARQQAEESVDESRATASALEAQHHLLRAQLKAQEHKSGRRRLLGRNR
jgi:hypothetical protein